MFLSRISRTKKRLSEDRWGQISVILAFFGLIATLTFGLRAVTMSGVYGAVPLEIPVMQAAINDPGYFSYKEQPRDSLTALTPTVVLTTDAFYFGDLTAFTSNYSEIRDKFIIRHVNGEPQLSTLLQQMTRWITARKQQENAPTGRTLVLVPSGDIPVPIMIQVVAGLRQSRFFERVVLGSGMF